jgi:cytochrome c551/c552
MQAKCDQCHRPNDIAPFSLLTYNDASTYAIDIATQVGNGVMPPWKPVAGYGSFRNSYALTDDERQTILDWVAAGAPEGDPANAPPPLPVNDTPWQLGQPDIILNLPQYTPSATASDTYRCFSLPSNLASDVYLNASQALPGAPQEVHHILIFMDETGESLQYEGQDGSPGYNCFGSVGLQSLSAGSYLGAWVPGARVQPLDPGLGLLVRAGSRIVAQVHYHPSGRASADQTSLGFYLAPAGSVQHRVLAIPVVNTDFTIPANNPAYPVTASFPVPDGITGNLIQVGPHMHLLGRQIAIDLLHPDQTSTHLIYIDNWDFNWQSMYTFTNQIPFTGGDTVVVSSVFDNSADNPNNPNNPIVPVSWGEDTTDEMVVGYIGMILDQEWLADAFLRSANQARKLGKPHAPRVAPGK